MKPSCPEACESEMVQCAITDDTNNMRNLYKSAQLVRQSIETFITHKPSQGSITVSSTVEDVPVELYTVVSWIIAGPAEKLKSEVQIQEVDRAAIVISQNLMFGFKSKRQLTYRTEAENAGFRSQHARENS